MLDHALKMELDRNGDLRLIDCENGLSVTIQNSYTELLRARKFMYLTNIGAIAGKVSDLFEIMQDADMVQDILDRMAQNKAKRKSR